MTTSIDVLFLREIDAGVFQTMLKTISTTSMQEKLDANICSPTIMHFLRNTFNACNVNEPWAGKKLCKIVVYCLKLIQERHDNAQPLSGEHLHSIIAVIIDGVQKSHYFVNYLSKICKKLINSIRQDDAEDVSWGLMLPAVLEKALEYDEILYNDEIISTRKFNAIVFDSLLEISWTPSISIPLAAMTRKMPIPESAVVKFMDKFTKVFHQLTPDTLPALMFHLLQLPPSTGFPDAVHLLFHRLQLYYGRLLYDTTASVGSVSSQSTTNERELGRSEASKSMCDTLIQLRELDSSRTVQQYIKYLNNITSLPEILLHPFNVTLLLYTNRSFACTSILKTLRAAIQRYYIEEEKRKQSYFLRDAIKPDLTLETSFQRIIEDDISYRAHITEYIIKLATCLVIYRPRLGEHASVWRMKKLARFIIECLLEKKISAFKLVLHELMQLLRSTHQGQLVDILAFLSRKYRAEMVQNIRIVLEFFNEITFTSNYATEVYLDIAMELNEFCPYVKDKILQLFHGTLFSRQKRLHLISIYLKLLKYARVKDPDALTQCTNSSLSSQLSMATQISLSSGHSLAFSNEAVCFNIIDNLNLCSDMRTDVAAKLYEGLPTIAKNNEHLCMELLDYLLVNLNNIASTGEANALPPIQHNQLARQNGNEAELVHPVSLLVLSFGMLLAITKTYNEREDIQYDLRMYEEVFTDVEDGMNNCEKEHFIQHPDLDLTDASPESQVQLLILHEYANIYEGFIAYYTASWTRTSTEHGARIRKLFKSYSRLASFLKEYRKPKKVDKNKSRASSKSDETANTTGVLGTAATADVSHSQQGSKVKVDSIRTILPLECVTRLMEVLYNENTTWAAEEQALLLKPMHTFHHYVLNSLIQIIETIKRTTEIDYKYSIFVLQHFQQIDLILYERCIKQHSNLKDFNTIASIKSLEAFLTLHECKFALIQKQNEETRLYDVDYLQLEQVIKTCQSIIDHIENDVDLDDVLILRNVLKIIALIAQEMPISRDEFHNELLHWLRDLNIRKEFTNKEIAAISIRCYLKASKRNNSPIFVPKLVALAIGSIVGWTNDPENLIEMAVINESTISTVLPTLFEETKVIIDDINWSITRIKNEYSYVVQVQSGITNAHVLLKNRERKICVKLNELMTLFTLFISYTFGENRERLHGIMLVTTTQFLNCVVNLAKYFQKNSTKENVAFKQAHFDQVIHNIFKKLVPGIYSNIDLIHKRMPSTNCSRKFAAQKIEREGKMTSKLVHTIEVLRRLISQISRKTNVHINTGIGTVWGYKIVDLTKVVQQQDALDDGHGSGDNTTIPESDDDDDGRAIITDEDSNTNTTT